MGNKTGGRVRVLLVDDDADDALITRRMLAASERYMVDWSQTTTEALKMLGSDHDVMLLDYRLSGDTGLDLLKQTRALGNDTPAVLLTGQLDDRLDEIAMHAGVADYLDKNGLNARELDRALRYAVDRGRHERDRQDVLMRERQARSEAQSAQRRTASILESITEAFIALDDQWTITFANRAASVMVKVPLDAMVGANLWSVLPALIGTENEERYRRAMRDRVATEFESFFDSLDIWTFAKIYPWADGIAIYIQDITARRTAEAGAHRLAKVLDDERALFSAVLHQMPVGVVIVDVPSGRLRSGNAEVARVWRHPFIASADVSEYGEWRGFHPDGRSYKAADWPIARTIATGEAVIGEVIDIVRGDETRGAIRLNSALVRTVDGETLAAVVTMEDVTQARDVDEAMRFQAHLLDVVGQAVIATNAAGIVTYWNHHAERLYGWSAAEVIGRNVLDVTPSDQASGDAADIFARLAQGESWSGEFLVRRRDGVSFPAFVTNSPILSQTGQLIGIVGVSFDVTERRKYEDSLKESEAFFRAAFLASPVGSTLTAPDGRIIQANPAFCALLGYDQSDLIGRHVIEFAHADDVGGVLTARERILRDEVDMEQHEKRYLHRDGHAVDCLASIALVRRPDGKPLYFTTQVIDTSDRKRAEEAERILLEERTEALRAMRRREQYFRSLIEHAADPVVIVDREGLITYASPAIESMLGMSPEELVGTSSLTLAHADDVARVTSDFALVLKTVSQSIVTEARSRHRDGSWRNVTYHATNLLDDPAVNGIVVNLRDVTDEKVMGQQLRQAQKLEAVGQLAGGVAHDFNNILTIIKLHGEFLSAALDTQDPRREDVSEITRAADRAAGLTRQLLAFSRQQILQPRDMDVNTVIEGITPMLRRLIGEDIQIRTVAGEGDLSVLADPGQVEQVLMNLAINARDAMIDGGTLTIETRTVTLEDDDAQNETVAPGNYVMIAVTDTGCGMAADVRDRVFEPFFTTKEPGQGTGLGLATVYGIIKQSSGYIRIVTEVGEGTCFKVYLPLVGGVTEVETPRATAPAPRGRETVLLAEDEEGVRSLSRRILMQQGYRVLEASNGTRALEMASAFAGQIDLVLTDVVMPHMNGRQLVERLQVERPDIKVLYASGYTTDEIVRRKALVPGSGRLLQKPFTAAMLATAVREVLDAPAAST